MIYLVMFYCLHLIFLLSLLMKKIKKMEEKEENLFPKTAPNCDVDLTPHWDYDLEKAKFINCPVVTAPKGTAAAATDDDDSTVAWVLVVVFADRGKADNI